MSEKMKKFNVCIDTGGTTVSWHKDNLTKSLLKHVCWAIFTVVTNSLLKITLGIQLKWTYILLQMILS